MPKFPAEHLELLKRHLTAENAHDLKGRCGHLKPWGVSSRPCLNSAR
jgi:hypothetical protein